MWGGQQFHPSVTPGFGTTPPSVTQGITVEQYMAIVAMHALMANPHYAPHTYSEMAQKAKEIAQAMMVVL